MIPQMRIELSRGDSAQITMYLVDLNDDALDVTGASFDFTIKTSPSDPDSSAVVRKRSGIEPEGVYSYNAFMGCVVVDILPGDIVDLLPTILYRWNLSVTLPMYGGTKSNYDGSFYVS